MNTGWGQHSEPGCQGFGTVQVNMMLRLFFGKSVKPQGCYTIDVTDVTSIGRFFVHVAMDTSRQVTTL